MRRSTLSDSAAALLFVSFAAAPALAHHGWSGQSDTQIEVSGKVLKPVSLAGPHATMQINADGQVWDVTLAPPARTESAGLTPKALAVGMPSRSAATEATIRNASRSRPCALPLQARTTTSILIESGSPDDTR